MVAAVKHFQRGFVLALDGKKLDASKLKPIRFDNGEPVYRFRVEAIRCGNWKTADGNEFTVTEPTLKHWADTFTAFRSRQIPVPVPSGSHFKVDGESNRGNVIALDAKGKSLWATVELIGKDAPRIAASNSVSIFAEPKWTDALGNEYEWPIRHLLLTPDPRIPGLKGFMPIAASNKTIHVPVLRLSNMFATIAKKPTAAKPVSALRRKPLGLDSYTDNGLGVPGVGDGAALPGDDTSTAGDVNASPKDTAGLKATIKEHFGDKAHAVLDDEEMEQGDKLEAMKELLTEMERILEAFSDETEADDGDETDEPEVDAEQEPKGAAMNNMPGKVACANPQTVQIAKLAAKGRMATLEGLFLSGQFPGGKPQYDRLVNRFCSPQKIASKLVLALSNGSDIDAEFDETIADFKLNPKSNFGERTGVQQRGAIALNNQYLQTEADAEKTAKEDADFCKPSSQRAHKTRK